MVTPISARIVVDTQSFTTGVQADPESTVKKTNTLLRILLKLTGQSLLLQKGGFLKQLLKLGGTTAALTAGGGLLATVAAGTIGAKGVGKITEKLTGGKIGFDELARGTVLAILTEQEKALELVKEDVDVKGEIVRGGISLLKSWFGIGDESEMSESIIKQLPDKLRNLNISVDNATNRFNSLSGIGGRRRHFGGRTVGVPIPDVSDPEVIAWNAEFGGPSGVQIGDSEYTDWIVIDVGGT